MERFKRLLPEITRITPLAGDEAMNVWEAYDESDSLIAYAFTAIVPEVVPDIPDMDEMDKYQVDGVVDPKGYKMINIDISLHPEGPEEPWTMEITEPEFESQYIGLAVEEIDLSPDGKIDAITDATLSSTWITDAIREKVSEIIDRSKSSP
jgi:hypothetical protein